MTLPDRLLIASVSGLRGLVGCGLDPIVASRFVAAYAAGLEPGGSVVLGHDARLSHPVFRHAVAAALMASGFDVLDVGPIATPTLGRYVRTSGSVGGIQISASHNPKEYNGLKFFQPDGVVLSPELGKAMLDRFESETFRWAALEDLGRETAIADADEDHIEAVCALTDVDRIASRQFRVLLDGCHGGGGPTLEKLLRRLGCQVIAIGTKPDGRYDHTPEPNVANLQVISRLMAGSDAFDLGFVLDPDADRLALLDSDGTFIGEEYTLVIAAAQRLKHGGPDGPLVANLSTSAMIDAVAKAAGRTVVRSPVGEFHVVQALRQHGGIFGGEGNGGVIDPRVGWVRDSLLGAALVLEALAEAPANSSLQDLTRPWPILVMVKDKIDLPAGGSAVANAALNTVADEIGKSHPSALIDRRDGLHARLNDRTWLHLRASNTEPIVRILLEAPDDRTADDLRLTAKHMVIKAIERS
jgi:phosphomannomutase